MPGKLENERHELYAFHRAKGFRPGQAAAAAGFAGSTSTIHRLENDDEIKVRIEELVEEQFHRKQAARTAAIEAAKVVGEMAGYSKSWVLTKLAEVAQMASSAEDFKSANDALKLIGEEFGMFKGGSAQPGETDRAKMMDISQVEDALSNTPSPAIPHTPDEVIEAEFEDQPPTEKAKPDISEIPADVLDLIAGQMKFKSSPPPKPSKRRISTGSETDVALEPREEAEEQGDPEPEDDAPPRRSATRKITK